MRTSTSLAGTALVLCVVTPAWAEPHEEARRAFQSGLELFAAGHFAQARASFEEAHRILPNPRVLANIAACFAQEGRAPEAVRTYRRFLREARDAPDRSRRDAQRAIAALAQDVGDVVLIVEPNGATVLIDGEEVGTAPLPGPTAAEPGTRTVEVRAAGHSPFSRSVTVPAGGEVNVSILLHALQQEDPQDADAAPPRPPEQRPASPPAPAASAPSNRATLLWVGIGVTTALALGAAVTGSLALAGESEYEDADTSIARRQALWDSTGTLVTVTDVLVVGAVVLGVATAAVFVLGPDGHEEEQRIACAAGPGGAWCGGSF